MRVDREAYWGVLWLSRCKPAPLVIVSSRWPGVTAAFQGVSWSF